MCTKKPTDTAAPNGASKASHIGQLIKTYGSVGLVTYLGVYLTTLGSLYLVVDYQMSKGEFDENSTFNPLQLLQDCIDWMKTRGIPVPLEKVDAKAGSFAIAWVCAKITEPLRFLFTVAITPAIARALGRVPK